MKHLLYIYIDKFFSFIYSDTEDAPSGKVNRTLPPTIAKLLNQATACNSGQNPSEPLFQLTYEYKPFASVYDYKFVINKICVVYKMCD